MSMPFYVAPEQFMKDKADFARKNIARGRPLVAAGVRRRHPDLRREPVQDAAQGERDLRPHRLRRGRPVQRVRPLRRAGVQHADIKGYQFSREDVDARSLANLYAQYMGNVFTHEMKPLEVEILVAEVGTDAGGRPAVPHPLRRHGRRRGPLHRARRRGGRHRGPPGGGLRGRLGPRARPSGSPPRPWPARNGRSAPPTWRWPSWPAPTGAAPSSRSTTTRRPAAGRAACGDGTVAGGRRRRRPIRLRPDSRPRSAAGRPERHSSPAGAAAAQGSTAPGHDAAETTISTIADQRPAAGCRSGRARRAGAGGRFAALVGHVEGRLHLVGEEQLLGALGVVLADPHRHVADGVGAVRRCRGAG